MATAKDKADMKMTINVRLNENTKVTVEIDPRWDVARLKEEISKKRNIPVEEINILFQGKTLHDRLSLMCSDLGDGSVLHMTKAKVRDIVLEATVPDGNYESMAPYSIGVVPEEYRSQFYVFCKSQCNTVSAGKIRVRCKKCLYGGFEVERDPQCWEDVLLPNQIHGQCDAENCNGNIADFFFKCKAHMTEEQESSVVLNLIKPNPQQVPCITCFEVENPVIQWSCDDNHAMCMECFKDYGTTKLNERSFVQKNDIGYTLPCPAPGCEESFVKEPHHFHIFGHEMYKKYQNFAAEEFVLNEGGVLCPKAGCGAPILPEGSFTSRRIRCFCGYNFCRECKEAYHNGECGKLTESTPVAGANGGKFSMIDAEHANQAAMRVIKDIAKPCPNPNCRVPTEKNGGCMHMTCVKCRFNWCWMCQKEWGRECQSDHWFGN